MENANVLSGLEGDHYSDSSTGQGTSYTYDKHNRVTAIDNPSDLGDEAFGYDDGGNLLWKKEGIVSGSGVVTLYRYDELNRLTNIYYNYTGSLETISYPGSADVTYTYDDGSQLRATMVDASGTSIYAYDERNRLTSYTPPKPANRTVTYGYNNLNQKTSVTVNSVTTNYEYFANGWLKNVKRGATLVAGYTYDYVGNRTRVDYGNSTYQTYSFEDDDPRYRLDMIEYAYKCAPQETVAVQGSLRLTRDNAGNPLTWSAYDTSAPAVNIYGKTYTYDANSRLDSAAYPGQSSIDYSYDWVGNRTAPGTMNYNNADQLTSWTGEHTYEYMNNGNLLYQKSNDGQTTQKTYAYTYANLVSSVTHNGVARQSVMTWDAAGNRVEFKSSTRANDGDTYRFVYDVTAGIPAVVEEVDPSSASTFYIREPNGALLARVTGSGETLATKYYHFDELGSTLYLTADNGTVSDKYTYDAWGNVTSPTGSTDQPYQYVGRLGYYRHYQDSNLPLYQLGVRLYSSEAGRFSQRDPMWSEMGLNDYGYCEADPAVRTDPTGLWPGWHWVPYVPPYLESCGWLAWYIREHQYCWSQEQFEALCLCCCAELANWLTMVGYLGGEKWGTVCADGCEGGVVYLPWTHMPKKRVWHW